MKSLKIAVPIMLATVAVIAFTILKLLVPTHNFKYEDAPPENRHYAYSNNDSKFLIKRNTNIDKGFNVTVNDSVNIDRGMSVSPNRIK